MLGNSPKSRTWTRKVPLRLVIVGPLILQFCAVVLLTGLITFYSGQKVPESDFHVITPITFLLCLLALLIMTVGGVLASRCLVRPILITIMAAESLSLGDWQQRVPDSFINEVGLLARAFNRMADELQAYFSELEYNAKHDTLTGLLNRSAYRLKLREAIYNYECDNSNLFAVLFLDLDYFKLINDSLGHLVGDKLLVEVSKRLQSCLKETDIIARFGGDEFVILLNNIADINDATQVATKILHICQQPFDLNNNRLFISTSIGIVLSTAGGKYPDDFLRDGDIALYRAKSHGKGGYRVFDAQMHAEAVKRLQMEIDLRRAIENEEFDVYYQPLIDIKTQEIIGFEALVRWPQAGGDIISPAEFISIAEETGLIVKLDLWMLRTACEQMQMWEQQFALTKSMFVSVNLSGKQFLQPDLLQEIEQIILETGIDVSRLKLEITETMLMSYGESTKEKLRLLKNLGINLAIDDFGTGYSSLSYLHQFPVNTLKIDRSFISRLGPNGENLEIVEAITVLAHKLGMDVIAEGVETTTQLEQLYNIGCEQVQGFLFSPPVTTSQATDLILGKL